MSISVLIFLGVWDKKFYFLYSKFSHYYRLGVIPSWYPLGVTFYNESIQIMKEKMCEF